MTGPQGWERRIGERRSVSLAPVRWHLSDDSAALPIAGHLVQLSVSGAIIESDVSDDLAVGAEVVVEHEGVRGHVIIRRVDPALDVWHRVYAVEFTGTDPALPDSMYTYLSDAELDDLRELWSGRYVD